MRVTKVDSIVLMGRYHLVRVFTDEGIDGVGEVSPMNACATLPRRCEVNPPAALAQPMKATTHARL